MNYEIIKEIRTVSGEDAINALLATGKWKILEPGCNDEGPVFLMVRVK